MKSLCVIAVLLAVGGASALGWCWHEGLFAKPPDSTAGPLQISDSDMVVGVKEGKLAILVNLIRHKSKLERLSESQATPLLIDAALTCSKGQLARAEYASHSQAVVQMLYIKPNEYGVNDFKTALKLGTVLVEKQGSDVKIAESTLKIPAPR